jgi:hypothetical protein
MQIDNKNGKASLVAVDDEMEIGYLKVGEVSILYTWNVT